MEAALFSLFGIPSPRQFSKITSCMKVHAFEAAAQRVGLSCHLWTSAFCSYLLRVPEKKKIQKKKQKTKTKTKKTKKYHQYQRVFMFVHEKKEKKKNFPLISCPVSQVCSMPNLESKV